MILKGLEPWRRTRMSARLALILLTLFAALAPDYEANLVVGLLGIAFQPDYADNGYFYLNFTHLSSGCAGDDECTKIWRYSVRCCAWM